MKFRLPLFALSLAVVSIGSPSGHTATATVPFETVAHFANRTPSSTAFVVAAAGAQRMMGGEGLGLNLPATDLAPTSFFIGQNDGAGIADIGELLDSMTHGEQVAWLESTIPVLQEVHEKLQAFRSNVRPTDLIENALSEEGGAGIGSILRELYGLLKALELTKGIPGIDEISQARRFASALDGVTLLLEKLIEREENGETINADDLRDLGDWMGDLESALGLLGSLGRVNPVIGAMLTVYGGALDAAAEVIDTVIIPYFQRLREARQVVEEVLGTPDADSFEGVDDGTEELDDLISELEERLAGLRADEGDPQYTDVRNARSIALRSLGIDRSEYERLRREWLDALHALRRASSWFDGFTLLRTQIQQAAAGAESGDEYFRAEYERYRAMLENRRAQADSHLDDLQQAYDHYREAFEAYMSVNDKILEILSTYSTSANPDDNSAFGGADFLLEHFPELFRSRWNQSWILRLIRNWRGDASDAPTSTETYHVIDITRQPELIATTPLGLAGPGPASGTGPTIVASIRATGNSTGPGAFDINFANMGKPARVEGEFPVFKPATEQQSEPLATLAEQMASVSSAANVVGAELGGYCLEKDLAPPGPGEFYVLAGAAEQRAFAPQRRILTTSRELYEQGALNPDSDPEAYFHSVRQWAVWTHEQSYDSDSFSDAFVEFTRRNYENAGHSWTETIESSVRAIAPNRFDDVVQVLERAREKTL